MAFGAGEKVGQGIAHAICHDQGMYIMYMLYIMYILCIYYLYIMYIYIYI